MLFYLNSERKFSVGSILEIPANIVLFQELASAKKDKKDNKSSGFIYQIVCDIQIHDPFIKEQSDHVYKPLKNGLFPDHETGGLIKEDFIKKITDNKTSRSIFSTFILLEQIKNFGFDGVFIFNNAKREVIIVKYIDAQIVRRI